MFPSDPGSYNPMQLMHLMRPDVEYINTLCSNYPPLHQVNCEIDGVPFIGQGNTFVTI